MCYTAGDMSKISFVGRDVISAEHFSREDIDFVCKIAKTFEPVAQKRETSDLMKGMVMASLFYEPSTRTRFSFETAMKRLGGATITAVGQDYSSLSKGETLWDTAKIVEQYADIIVVRHPRLGSAQEMADAASIPVINGGDGPGHHPTQALLDIYSMMKERGGVDGLTIMISGDLKYGRTTHSLLYLLRHFKVKMLFVSPPELKMPDEYLGFLRESGVAYEESEDFEAGLRRADVVYATRIQQERFSDPMEYERLKDVYILTREVLERCSPKITILHPLPRIGEIARDVDDLYGAAYFRQAGNGVPIRMALLALVSGRMKI